MYETSSPEIFCGLYGRKNVGRRKAWWFYTPINSDLGVYVTREVKKKEDDMIPEGLTWVYVVHLVALQYAWS